jgi:hypothetical protein
MTPIELVRKYARIFIIGFLVLVAVWMFFYFRSFGWIEITATRDTPNKDAVAVTVIQEGREDQTLSVKAGASTKVRVKAGKVRVDSKVQSISSLDVVRVSGFKTTQLTVPSGQQQATKQLASGAQFCPVLVGDQVYSYNCNGLGPVLKHTDVQLGNSRNKPLFDEEHFAQLRPLQNGLIGFPTGGREQIPLIHIDLNTETVRQIPLPESLPATTTYNTPQIIVPTDPTDERFALTYGQAGKIFMFDSVDDTSPTVIEPKQGAKISEKGRVVRGSFSGDHLVLYLGMSRDTNEGTNTDEELPQLQNVLLEYDKDGKQVDRVALPDDITAQGMYKLKNGFYAADDTEGFDFYYRDGDKMELVYTFTSMAGWTISGDDVYVQVDNTLYEFTPKNDGLFGLHSRFVSSVVRVSDVYNTTKGVVFTGFAGNDTTAPLNVYQLLSEKEPTASGGQTSPSRLEPDYKDLERLSAAGMSAAEIANTRYALDKYINTLSAVPSVQISGIQTLPHDPNSASMVDAMTFLLTLNGTTYNAKLEYSNLVDIQLFIYDLSGGQMFDSGKITGKQPKL